MTRICPNCNSVLDENMRFCIKCGKPMEITENKVMHYPEEIVENGNRSRMSTNSFKHDFSNRLAGGAKSGFPVWILILLLILVGGTVAVYFILFSNVVRLNKYIDIHFEGTDGDGIAYAEFNEEAFISDYGTKIKYKTGIEWLDQTATLFSTPAALMRDSCIKGSLDKTNGLSNGDEVVFTWDCDDVTASRYFDTKLKYSDIKRKVKGLSEPDREETLKEDDTRPLQSDESSADSAPTLQPDQSSADSTPSLQSDRKSVDDTPSIQPGNGNVNLQPLDPFANLEIQYDGVSPYLKVFVSDGHSIETVQQHVTFSLKDGTEYVACGQEFTLTANFDPDLLANDGFQITTLEKQYTVPNNFPRFLTGEEEIDLIRVRNDLYDYLEAHASGAVGQDGFWVQNDMDFVNHAHIGKDGLYNPEITKIDSVTEIKHYWMNRKKQYDEENSIHNRFAILYKIEISARGYKTNSDPVDYKRTAYSLVSAENIYTTEDGVSWTGTNGLGGEKIICHSQMDEKDQLLSSWMTTYKNEYNIIEVEPQKEDN